MAKVAKLVTVIVTTRVIVEDTATRDEIMVVAREPLANVTVKFLTILNVHTVHLMVKLIFKCDFYEKDNHNE